MDRGQATVWMTLVAALVLGVPGAAAYHPQALPDGHLLEVWNAPDPVPADARFSVHARVANASLVKSAWMKYCLSEDQNATACYPSVPMLREGGQLTATAEHAIPGGREFGYNLTIRYANGTKHYYPSGPHEGGNAYVFLTTQPAERATPTTPGLTLLLLPLLAALHRRMAP